MVDALTETLSMKFGTRNYCDPTGQLYVVLIKVWFRKRAFITSLFLFLFLSRRFNSSFRFCFLFFYVLARSGRACLLFPFCFVRLPHFPSCTLYTILLS